MNYRYVDILSLIINRFDLIWKTNGGTSAAAITVGRRHQRWTNLDSEKPDILRSIIIDRKLPN